MTHAVTGRLAPSPTGLLHLGNAWAFLLAWLGARVSRGRVVLRMEDIDPERSRPEWAVAIMEDLTWLGLDWDAGPEYGVVKAKVYGDKVSDPLGPYEQSQCGAWYDKAFAMLDKAGLVYPCYCTRKELRSLAGAPHGFSAHAGGPGISDVGAPYPGTCRALTAAQRAEKEKAGRKAAWRFACPAANTPIEFDDMVLGQQVMSLEECGGDFPLRRSDGVWAYQLAVTVDDARMGVNQVVRGEDIVVSTPRQISLLQHMGHAVPQYAHIPLLHDERGERLAKRHQSLSLRSLREAGIPPEAIIGALGALIMDTQCRGEDGLLRFHHIHPLSPLALCARLQHEGTVFPWHCLRPPHPAQLNNRAWRVPDALITQLHDRHKR